MKECPRCHEMTLREQPGQNALSRRDNKTYICSDCGDREAMIDMGMEEPDEFEKEFTDRLRV